MPPGSRAIRERETGEMENIVENLEMEERGEGMGSDVEREERGGEQEEDAAADLLRDRFRLCTISIAESEATRNNVEISQPIVACIADLAFKYTEQLAKDLELFSQHAGRKSVNMEDVILSAHRNEHLTALLRVFCNDLKAKEPQSERKWKRGPRKDKAEEVNQSGMKRKKGPRKEDKAVAGETSHIADL